MCVCVCERERERENFRVCACARICESARTCGRTDVSARQDMGARVCAYICVCEEKENATLKAGRTKVYCYQLLIALLRAWSE